MTFFKSEVRSFNQLCPFEVLTDSLVAMHLVVTLSVLCVNSFTGFKVYASTYGLKQSEINKSVCITHGPKQSPDTRKIILVCLLL